MKMTFSRVKKAARKDGRPFYWQFWPFFKNSKTPTPPVEQETTAFFEDQLYSVFNAELDKIEHGWHEYDKKIMPKYCQSLDDFERLKKEYETDNQEKQELRKRYIQAEEAYQDMQPPSINPNWALFWLVLIAIAEFPLNSIVFEIFGQERIETYIMSGIICIGIPLMAHFLGKAGRKEIKSGTDKAILIICPLIVLSMLVAIAIIRMLYFKEMTTKINASPETMTIIFVIINIFIFVVATIISYNAAHPKPEEFKAKRKKYLQIKKQIRRDDKEGIVLVGKIEKCSFSIHSLKNSRINEFNKARTKVQILHDNYETYVNTYRYENFRARRSSQRPKCFELPARDLEIPALLENGHLEWDCKHYKSN